MKLMQFFVIFYPMRLTQACGSSIKEVKLVASFDINDIPDWKKWELPPYNDDWWGFISLLGTREVAKETTTGGAKTTESLNVEGEEGFPKQWKGIGDGNTGFEAPEWAHVKEDIGQPSVCFDPPLKGNGTGWYLRWYYDFKRAKCRRYIYSGSGGSGNKFISNVSCAEVCAQPLHLPHVPERLFDYALFLKPIKNDSRRFVVVH